MTKRAPLTDEEKARIAELRERGLTIGQIAHRMKCSRGSAAWAILAMGVDLYPDKAPDPVPTEPVVYRRGGRTVRRFTAAEDARLLELERQGLATYRIARTLGRQNNSVIGRMRTLARRDARLEAREARQDQERRA